MRIAILVCELSGGGAERVASLWVKGFYERGFEVSVILNNNGRRVSYQVPRSVAMYNMAIGTSIKLFKFVLYPFRILKLRCILKKIRPEYLITVLHPMGLYALIASLGLKLQIINTEHNAFERPEYAKLSLWESFCKFKVNKWFNAVTVLTYADKEYIGSRLNNVFVLPNPLTQLEHHDVPRNSLIVAAGRINAWHVKGVDLLIDAWARIHEQFPQWSVLIVGDGSSVNMEYLEKLALKNHVSNSIHFVGYQEDISAIFSSAEIFVLSSRYEGFGMVLLEAMSQGCACIACDYKGRQKEIVGDEKNGLICPSNDVDSLMHSIVKMIEDVEYRHLVQNNAPIRADLFSLERIMFLWEKILSQLG